MARARFLPLLLALPVPALARAGSAQTPAAYVDRGVLAYQNLDFDSAAALLRRGLIDTAVPPLAPAARARALMYLGASELFRERRDSAAAAFRRLVLLEPRYRPDQLVFPPEVTGLFQETRLGTKAVAVVLPPATEIGGGGERLPVRLYATSYHEVTARLAREDGAPLRVLYAGAIGDSLELLWDGRDSAGASIPDGGYQLSVTSRAPDGRILGSTAVPLFIRRVAPDTMPWPAPPPDSLLRPERSTGRGALRALLTALASAGAVTALPLVVSGSSQPSAARFAVAGAIGLSGVTAYALGRAGRPIPANVAANRALQDAWRRSVEDVRAQNAARQRQARLVIRAGEPVARYLVTP